MARRILLWFAATVFVLFFGAVAIGGVVSGIVASQRVGHETATATATVTSKGVCRSKAAKSGHGVFSVGGIRYTTDVACQAKVGDRVPVKYDPSDPSHNQDREHRTRGFLIGAVGLVGLLVGGRPLIRALRRERGRRVQ